MENIYLNKSLVGAAERLGAAMRESKISIYLTGLAASGKSAVAEIVSQLTGIPLVDSGLPFRLAAYLCETIPAAVSDLTLFDRLINAHSIHVINGAYRIFSGVEDVTEKLRSPEIERDVPRIAGDSRLREIVLRFLRSTTTAPAIVAARGATEPLTSGSLVQIELKCDFDERVSRRAKQLGLTNTTVRKSIRERDARDLQGPSRYPSSDFVDSTNLTLDATVSRVIDRATERFSRVHEYRSFRRLSPPSDEAVENPLLSKAWDCIKSFMEAEESRQNIPIGHAKARYLLHLSRFSSRELFAGESPSWTTGAFAPKGFRDSLASPDIDLLQHEAVRIIEERKIALNEFLRLTCFDRQMFSSASQTRVRRAGRTLIAEGDARQVVEHLHLKDASRECGAAIERYLHYLGVHRLDTTHRLLLVEESTDYPVLYMSFSPNSRKYFEPLLWALGLRMEEVAVAVRGFGSPRCPRNAMGLFLRMCCKRVSDDFRHLRAVITDINPNWGFTGSSFREAGFITIGTKYAPTLFEGEEYVSRRGIDRRPGQKAATMHKLPLVPTLIMVKPLDDAAEKAINGAIKDGLYIVPRSLYDMR
jgi:cytidylate kinase